ncbi:hypothetical protein JX266_011712 [Neoarthrinium moseri]|uniref:uncharacterized protein n=1 Tax=Neoarthrinium moseri TaxID=1658444 RepID=UPI001FDD8A3B|nr:uncharacterized protein JN550_002929 [Neoarthrinium moseri]KAI1842061.1 hypothetical protein JX266_011712 [Neoarthrinium moseri]KAI1874350.1 hypothetical protein JN550_002929 [Neoarthrinium moseri]
MDMDAWNWASESDWWAHYLLTGDYKSTLTPQPALLFVSHEARAESLRAYKQLQISKPLLRRCLADDAVDDRRLERMRHLAKTPKLNVNTDVLEWAQVKRWSRNNPSKCGALFLAASMSVQHIVVEYDHYLHTSLVALALAVLDVESPLKSLTIKVNDSTTQEPFAFRLTSLPEHVETTSRQVSSLFRKLSQYDACMLPGYRPPLVDTERLQPKTLDRSTLGSFTRPFPPGTRLNTGYAIFRVASDREVNEATELIPAPGAMQGWKWMDMVDEPDRTAFNTNMQGDIALFMHRLSIYEQWDYEDGRRHPTDIIPFHGICLSHYGLP